jgi:RHS repeat-associated protein
VNGTLVQGFLYEDQLRIAVELDGNGDVVSRFVYGTRINVPEYMIKGGSTYRILTDHLGSPRLVINTATGAVAQRMAYDEFGRVTTDTNPGFQPFGFAGGVYDRDTTFVRFGARDYDPARGRWTSKDPILFASESANHYVYAQDDPINLADPWGLQSGTGSVIWDFWAEATGAYENFKKRDAELKKLVEPFWRERAEHLLTTEDEYYHCLSHCEAYRDYGLGGAAASQVLGLGKEVLDTLGYERGRAGPQGLVECRADLAANAKGREAAAGADPCERACDVYRTPYM